MHLKTIKLAGFKSFVDPTTIQLRSALTAVVGPNGCGKSNIVDAVRWVIGESSAKYLRAADMSEVIFSGSATRKPLAQASVELIFDNTDGKLGGEYAAYAEISVRRVVERDGQSQYFLNNHRSRRRDITDIFLGTGLGPRSYAIIEQGMVTRLIDAKPEELAVYLKEVAGISKYEERRKETEQHMRQTKENLDRVSDICGELIGQADRLQEQVKAAELYRVLKEDTRLLKTQLHIMQWQTLEKQSQAQSLVISECEDLLKDSLKEQDSIESNIEVLRTQQTLENNQNSSLQNRDYQLGTEQARLEQKIQYTQQFAEQIEALEKHIKQDRLQYAELEEKMLVLRPDVDTTEQQAKRSLTNLQDFEEKIRREQEGWDKFVTEEAQALKQVEINKHHVELILQRSTAASKRQERLNAELGEIAIDNIYTEINNLDREYQELELAHKTASLRSLNSQEQIQEQRAQVTTYNKQLAESLSRLQNLQGRLISLETVQHTVLKKPKSNNNNINIDWDKLPCLAQKITVEKGWERAAEIALQGFLAAVCTPDFQDLAQKLSPGLSQGSQDAVIFNTGLLEDTPKNLLQNHPELGELLLSKITAPWSLLSLLSGVYIAENLDQALKRMPFLEAHESIITPEGVWLGQAWLKIDSREKQISGVLVREQMLQELSAEIIILKNEIIVQEKDVETAQNQLGKYEQVYQVIQQECVNLINKRNEIQTQLAMLRSQLSHAQKRQTDLQRELSEITENLAQDKEQLSSINKNLGTAQQKAQENTLLRVCLLERRSEGLAQLDVLRKQLNIHQELLLANNKNTETIQQQMQFLLHNIERADKQLLDLLKQRETDLSPLDKMEAGLVQILQERSSLQINLQQVKQKSSELDRELLELTSQQRHIKEYIDSLRIKLEPLQLERQTALVRAASLQEQMAETGGQDQDLAKLLSELPQAANEDLWQQRIQRNTRKLDNLGPINLAAQGEHDALIKRKQEMEEQQQDLNEALKTLEEVINKIDQETRILFKETFDKANQSFQVLFPKIFTGGIGSLALTEGDLFTAGVIIMAQPAGKRNARIQSLSGGEKALTAIALIFALFELNPAPFCILDEVDAPLDDQNVGRFCDLVKEISQQVQFIVVTHNKLAMEMAEQLMGITMQESGVSRTVAVDMEEAIAWALQGAE